MIGRGLLMNPALAIEYKEKKSLSTEDMKERLYKMHKIVFTRYEERLEGGEDQLLKLFGSILNHKSVVKHGKQYTKAQAWQNIMQQ